jgi:hypothetical protein
MRPDRIVRRLALVIPMAVAVAGCNPPAGGHDTTGPDFAQITVTAERVTDGFDEPAVDATGGVTLDHVQLDRRFVIKATVGDPQSGVSEVHAGIDAKWTCSDPASGLGSAQNPLIDGTSEEAKSGQAPSGAPAVRNATFNVDPLGRVTPRLPCAPTDDASPITLQITIHATNGKGLVSASKAISITYQGRPAGPP